MLIAFATSEHMSATGEADLVEKLQILLEADVNAAAQRRSQENRAPAINAAKADAYGGKNAINLLNGQLRRGRSRWLRRASLVSSDLRVVCAKSGSGSGLRSTRRGRTFQIAVRS